MKKLFVILLSTILVIGALAQRGHGAGHYYYRPHTRVVIGVGAGYYPYSYYPYDYGFYHPYYYRPSRLQLQIEDIQADYRDRIWSVKHDNSLSRRERRERVHELKSQREEAIRDAERNYYRSY